MRGPPLNCELISRFHILSPSFFFLSRKIYFLTLSNLSTISMAPAALALNGFSIREYVASMRGVNFEKCWPFSGIDKEVETKSLPQICVRKYRFWADEIVNDEQNEEQSKTRKQKTPKKRSIVEIFAVSPKMKDGARKNKSRGKGKNVKKKIQVEICSAKKVKSKPTSDGISHTLKNSLRIGKKNPNDDKKKPLFMKNLAKSRKLKLLQSTKLITEKRRKLVKGSQVHSILKNRAKDLSKKPRAIDSETCANSCTHIDIPQLRSLCKKFSDVLAASTSLQNTQEINNRLGTDDTSAATNMKERSNIEIFSEKGQLSESCCDVVPQIFEKQHDAYPSAMGKNNAENMSSYTDNQVKDSTPNTVDMFSCVDNRVRGSTLKTVDLQYSQSLVNNLMGKSSSRNEVDLNKRLFPSLEPVNDSTWKTVEFYPAQSSLPTRKEKGSHDNFVGLPLNSQGELIDFQSGSKFGYRETGPTHPNSRIAVDFRNVKKGKFPSINVNQIEQLNFLQDPYLNTRKPAMNSERFGGQNIETCQGSMQNYHTRNYIDNVNFQSNINHAPHSDDEHTMRLMGTNVIIGSENCRGRQSYNNGKSSFDKEVIFNRQNPQYWKPQQTYQTSSNHHRFNSLSNLYPRPIFSTFENQPQWVSRNNPPANGNINRFNQQFPVNYQHMMLSSTHCKHSLGISPNTASDIYHPFLSQEYSSSQNPTHWLLNSNFQKKNQEIKCSCFSNSAYQHNSGMPQMNNFPFRPPQFTCNTSFPDPTATFPNYKPRTAVDKFSGTEKVYRDGTNSNFTYLKSFNGSSKARKRPAVTNIDFVRPKKAQYPTSVSKNIVSAESSRVVDNECMAPCSSGSKEIDTGKSCGPVKLSAGAKHVLKPGFDINEDYPVPTHSTLTYDSALDISMKRSEIYRF